MEPKGRQFCHALRSTGRLLLGINDEVLSDNSGAFRVVVYH